MKKVTVVVPTYNEKDNIESLLKAIIEIFAKLTQYELSIIVVDDYSPDGTAAVVTNLSKKYPQIELISKNKEGLGAAYVFGIRYALKKYASDLIFQIDADWSHDPQLIPQFLEKVKQGADFVIGSRYIKGGAIPPNWGLHRKIYSVIGNNVVRFGLGMLSPHDWTSGYRLMTREVFEKISENLEKYSGYNYQVVSLHRAKLLGFVIGEVPLKFIDRVKGKSKIAPIDYIKNLLTYIVSNSTFLKYVVVGVIGFSTQAIIYTLLNRLGLFAGISVMIGSFFAIVCNFLGNNLWTFNHSRIKGAVKLLKKFVQFFTTSIGAIVIQGVVVSAGVLILGEKYQFWYMVFAIAFLVIPYNYFIYNKFIWKTHKRK